jgi:hypothetical protein
VHIAAKCIKTWVTKRNITERNTLTSLFSKKRSQIYPHRNQGKKGYVHHGCCSILHRRPILRHLKGSRQEAREIRRIISFYVSILEFLIRRLVCTYVIEKKRQ